MVLNYTNTQTIFKVKQRLSNTSFPPFFLRRPSDTKFFAELFCTSSKGEGKKEGSGKGEGRKETQRERRNYRFRLSSPKVYVVRNVLIY